MDKNLFIFDDPNKWAGEATFLIDGDDVIIEGYQKFVYPNNDTKHTKLEHFTKIFFKSLSRIQEKTRLSIN